MVVAVAVDTEAGVGGTDVALSATRGEAAESTATAAAGASVERDAAADAATAADVAACSDVAKGASVRLM